MRTIVAVLLAGMLAGAVRGADDAGNVAPKAAPAYPSMWVETKTVAEAEAEIAKLTARMTALTNDAGLNPHFAADISAIDSRIGALAEEKERVMVVLEGRKWKEAAIQEKIAKVTNDGKLKMEKDKFLAALRALAADRQKAAEAAQADPLQSNPAMLRAAEAAGRVEERREAIMAEQGGGSLTELNRELVEASLDIGEQEAKVKYINRRIGQLREAKMVAGVIEDQRQHERDMGNAGQPEKKR